MYPSPPDFTSAGPDAFNPPAWWTYTRSDGSVNVCESTGSAVVRRARAALNLSDIPVWDSDLQAALLAQSQGYNNAQPGAGWQPLVNELQSGLSQQSSPSNNVMRFAVWVGYYQQNGLRLDAISIPSSATMPAFGVTLPDGPGGNVLTCFDPSRDPAPGVLSANDLSVAQSQSTTGIRLHPGETLPAPVVVPPGPAGLSTGAIVGILLTAAAVVTVVVIANRSYTERSSQPQQPEPRASRTPRATRSRSRSRRSAR